ncbi:MAG: hypothetical protein HQ546_05125, partial [Planctomycetes bacterium]|nr:hypothetical protein [Planctomycetota bacterium]
MSLPSSTNRRVSDRPLFEQLEDRLLLTTLDLGHYFIYLNSKGNMVRVDFDYATGAADFGFEVPQVELIATWENPVTGNVELVDLVGIRDGDPFDPVNWPDGQEIIEISDDGTPSWVEYAEGTDTEPAVRGARTEIYAIYLANTDIHTVITAATLTANTFDPNVPWRTDLDLWKGTPNLIRNFDDEVEITSPAGSGGVIVGAVIDPITDEPIRYQAWPVYNPPIPEESPPIGIWPGYRALHAGVTVSEENVQYGAMLGNNVLSMAVNNASVVYGVDSSAFIPATLLDVSYDGLGQDVQALAVDSSGEAYAVNNSLAAYLVNPDAPSVGQQIDAMAVDATGLVYAVERRTDAEGIQTWYLVKWDGQDIDPDAEPDAFTIGALSGWDIRSLDFDPATGALYGVGWRTAADALTSASLVTINPTDASITTELVI